MTMNWSRGFAKENQNGSGGSEISRRLNGRLTNMNDNGEVFAFVAVTTDTGSTVGAAVKGERGYSKLSNMPEFATYDQAHDYADTLNAKLGLTTLEAWKIVASTMR